MNYIRGTIELRRTIGADSLNNLKAWADASYAVHENARGHTGGVISFGKGMVHHKSAKQRLNAKSSTETEVIGASDYFPWVLWCKRFLEKQGYPMNSTIFYQDNESAIKMETNGMRSCSDKSRHIHIRYFFVKDISEQEKIKIEHCRTEKMIADYFTKPLQGSLFKKMRGIIMGITDYPTEERVGDQNNDQITVRQPIDDVNSKDYAKVLPAAQGKHTRVICFNMRNTRGWRLRRQRLDRVYSL